MTTIVADLTQMSADSWETGGSRIMKMYRAPGLIIGYAGEVFQSVKMCKWVLDGCRGAPPVPADADIELLILRKTGLTCMDGEGVEVPYDTPYAAIGTGAAVAHGAMWKGATTVEAIEAAATHDGCTKLPVHTLTLKGRK